MRGKEDIHKVDGYEDRITPAHAGKSETKLLESV